jgi:serine/threonine protein kinase
MMFVLLHGYPPFHADQKVFGELLQAFRSFRPHTDGAAAGRGTDDEIFRLIRQGFRNEVLPGYKNHFPQKIPISPAARSLIARLLEKDPAKRPTAQEALEDPWFLGGAPYVLGAALRACWPRESTRMLASLRSAAPIAASVFDSLYRFQNTSKFNAVMLETMTNLLSEAEIKRLKARRRRARALARAADGRSPRWSSAGELHRDGQESGRHHHRGRAPRGAQGSSPGRPGAGGVAHHAPRRHRQRRPPQ